MVASIPPDENFDACVIIRIYRTNDIASKHVPNVVGHAKFAGKIAADSRQPKCGEHDDFSVAHLCRAGSSCAAGEGKLSIVSLEEREAVERKI